jgi:5-methylcytosine-specific restriction endonuclease McrA
LLFLKKVELVEEYEDREIRSVTFAIKMPSVVRFIRALRHRKKVVKFSRENTYARDNGSCQYCGKRVTRAEATYDHVVPRSRGGHTDWTNIVIACMPCNQRKGGRLPDEAGMRLQSIPVKPKKLPDTLHLTFTWQKGMPESWRSYLRDLTYWHGELVSD